MKGETSSGKLKVAVYWAAGCGGCDVGLLDINEKILDVFDHVDIVFWPAAMDIKYDDLENLSGLDVAIVNGSIRNDENEHMTRLLRKKSKILVAFGSCACEGGTLGLANLSSREDILKTVYYDVPQNNNLHNRRPLEISETIEGPLTLPTVRELNQPLDGVVKVDYYLSGCPPPVDLITDLFQEIVNRSLPKPGSYIAPDKSICDECDREKVSETIKSINRLYNQNLDPEKCFLEQSILCMGPATRGGCKAKCLQANIPCGGCGGRTNAADQGARMIGALGAILPTEHEQDTAKLLEGLRDPVGSLYRYCFSTSLVGKGVRVERE